MWGELWRRLYNLLAGSGQKSPAVKPELLPKSTKTITGAELRVVLFDIAPSAAVFLSDKEYKLCCKTDVWAFLKQDATNQAKFVREEYDCDDFSYRLMGQFSVPGWSALAFGIIWTEKHALNCYINEDQELMFIEPQADQILSALEPWMGTKIRLIIM